MRHLNRENHDVSVIGEELEFLAHKVVLAASSSKFFQVMFGYEAFTMILKYVYNQRLVSLEIEMQMGIEWKQTCVLTKS